MMNVPSSGWLIRLYNRGKEKVTEAWRCEPLKQSSPLKRDEASETALCPFARVVPPSRLRFLTRTGLGQHAVDGEHELTADVDLAVGYGRH